MINKIISICIVLGAFITLPNLSAQNTSANFQVFYDELSPYGTWIETPDYGYVWMPDVDSGFVPYATNGYWVLTDEGWAWASDYPWGWAPFHYGRWYSDPAYGPMWIPDNVWGPGWVYWRQSSDYYGWAPLGPEYGSGHYEHNNRWTFVRGRHMGEHNMHNYYIKSRNNDRFYNNSTEINNVREDPTRHSKYNAGPGREDVEKHTGRKITPVNVAENSRPGQNLDKKQFKIYRPEMDKNTGTGPKPAPPKVGSYKDLKTTEQRIEARKQQKITPPAQKQPTRQQQAPRTQQPDQPTKQPQSRPQQPKESSRQQAPQPKQEKQQPIKQQQAPRTQQPDQSIKQPQSRPQQPKESQQQPKQGNGRQKKD